MYKIFILLFALVSVGNNVLAQQAPSAAQEKPRIDFEKAINDIFGESSGGIRYRRQTNPDGSISQNQLEYQLDLNMVFKLTPDGKLKLVADALTGQAPDRSWDQTGVGNTNRPGDFNMRLRKLYADYSPTDHLSFQGGAMPTIPAGIDNNNVLQVDRSGWVDGARATYSELATWADQITVTVGMVDEYDKTSVFSRNMGMKNLTDPNFIQVHISGNLGKRLKYLAEGTEFNEQDYLRGVAEIALQDVVKFVDAVVVEDLIKTSRTGSGASQEGFALTFKKAISDYNITAGYSYKTASISARGPDKLLLQNEYGQGKNLNFTIERPLKWGTPYMMASKSIDSGVGLRSLQGTRVEAGVKVKLGRKSRSATK